MNQTIHHPPAGEILYPTHETSAACWCKPERKITYKRRSSRQGHDATIHFWHNATAPKEEK